VTAGRYWIAVHDVEMISADTIKTCRVNGKATRRLDDALSRVS